MSVTVFENMIGRTMVSVDQTGDTMTFKAEDGAEWYFCHYQDCCENVSIEDICGDLEDLVGSPMVIAEEVDSEDPFDTPDNVGYLPESYTWTFYKFATNKGSVTVRWLGTSNGYYGEGVSVDEKLPGHKPDLD